MAEQINCDWLKGMADWIKGDSDENCLSCRLAPVTQWYYGELKEAGLTCLADILEESTEKDNPETLCLKLDAIKTLVDDKLRTRLFDFDCAAQSPFNADAQGGEIVPSE